MLLRLIFRDKKERHMRDLRGQAISAIKLLVSNKSGSITDDDLNIFERSSKGIEQCNKRLPEIYKAMFYGFFHCAAKGLVLVPENRVTEIFKRPIKDNYPEANEGF